MARNQVQFGAGRIAMSLGGAEPRKRRTADQQQASASRYGPSLTIDKRQRLIVKPSEAVAPSTFSLADFAQDPAETSDAALTRLITDHNTVLAAARELQGSYNQLLRVLQRAGFVRGGQ